MEILPSAERYYDLCLISLFPSMQPEDMNYNL